jgi:hypothetical protein
MRISDAQKVMRDYDCYSPDGVTLDITRIANAIQVAKHMGKAEHKQFLEAFETTRTYNSLRNDFSMNFYEMD